MKCIVSDDMKRLNGFFPEHMVQLEQLFDEPGLQKMPAANRERK